MHGIPVLIKDNIDTADRMMTTAGSLALVGSKPRQDSFVAQKLRARRRGDSGQDQSQRVGKHSLQPLHQRMERPRRPDQKSLRARPQSLRVELRYRRGHLRQLVSPSGSAPKPTAPSFARPRRTDSPASSPRSAWSAAAESFRFRIARIAPGPCAAPCATPRFCWARSPASIPHDAATAASAGKSHTDYAQYLRSRRTERRAHRRGAEIFRLQRCRRCSHGAVARCDEEAGSDAG